MKVQLVFVLVAFFAFVSCKDLRQEFKKWTQEYEKVYKNKSEMEHRFNMFKKNYNKIELWNELGTYGEATFGLNQFSDLAPQEFKNTYASCYKSSKTKGGINVDSSTTVSRQNVPASFDWRTEGAVTGVKNQGQCGSCWSFSTTGTVEGALFIATKNLVGLSEQNLVDCGNITNNDGCDGGRVDWGVQYIVQNHGIDTESSYPYTGEDGSCKYSAANIGAVATGWNQTATGDEEALKVAVATIGPIGVAIAVDDAFANYASGVFVDTSCPNDPDDLGHAVLVVGYGTSTNGTDYWIVKNSWGATWGNQGYILMARNHNNMCGIATDAVYPIGVNSKF